MNLKGFTVRGTVRGIGDFPPAIKKTIAFLESLPFKELVTLESLSVSVDVTEGYLYHFTRKKIFDKYRFRVRDKLYLYGSERTIEELNRANRGRQ